MGCFSVSGVVSKLGITCGEKVVFIPMIASDTHFNNTKDGSVNISSSTIICSNELSCVYYKPAFLPIYGEYDEYGCIENIVHDDNTKYIENLFGINIDTFIDIVTGTIDADKCGLSEKNVKFIKTISGCFEYERIYNEGIKYQTEIASLWNNSYLTMDLLNVMGFVYDNTKDTGDSRYRNYLSHDKLDGLVIHSDS